MSDEHKAVCEWLGIEDYSFSTVVKALRKRKVKPMTLEVITDGILATFGPVKVVGKDGGEAFDKAVFELMKRTSA